MPSYKDCQLPYRTTPDDLKQFIEAVNRGRNLEQIQSLFQIPAAFQGTVHVAQELGFFDHEKGALKQPGKDFLLDVPNRPTIIMQSILTYEPYQLLLEAIFARNKPVETPLEWIMNWWGTHNYGSSQTNREEGATTFAKFLEYTEVAKFVIGRRGKSTRIEWSKNVNAILDHQVSHGANVKLTDIAKSEDALITTRNSIFPANITTDPVEKLAIEPQYNTLSLTLGGGKSVQIRLPATLTTSEKSRLLQLMDLLIEVKDDVKDAEE